jgi:hypothetical protein
VTVLLRLDYTPLETYQTTEEQKLYAAIQAVGRVPRDELPDILGMFGLIEKTTEVQADPQIETCKRGHPWDDINTRRTADGYRSCRTCERNGRTGQNR